MCDLKVMYAVRPSRPDYFFFAKKFFRVRFSSSNVVVKLLAIVRKFW